MVEKRKTGVRQRMHFIMGHSPTCVTEAAENTERFHALASDVPIGSLVTVNASAQATSGGVPDKGRVFRFRDGGTNNRLRWFVPRARQIARIRDAAPDIPATASPESKEIFVMRRLARF